MDTKEWRAKRNEMAQKMRRWLLKSQRHFLKSDLKEIDEYIHDLEEYTSFLETTVLEKNIEFSRLAKEQARLIDESNCMALLIKDKFKLEPYQVPTSSVFIKAMQRKLKEEEEAAVKAELAKSE